MPSARPKRRRLQFSLGTLFLVVTVVAVLLGIETNRVARQRRAVAAIQEMGGTVMYDYQFDKQGKPRKDDPEPPGPTWLRRLIGDDYFRTVAQVRCKGDTVATLEYAPVPATEHLPNSQWIRLSGPNAHMTDADLKHLRAFPKLRTLVLQNTGITDQGMVHLKGLAHLGELNLHTTRISDDGLAFLCDLQLERLHLNETLVTDAGLTHLNNMKTLKYVNLNATRVTDAGVAALRRALPKARIMAPRVPVVGIEHYTYQPPVGRRRRVRAK